MDHSIFSEGVRVNETRDSVFVPYHGSDFILALMAEADATVTIDGSVPEVEITRNLGKGRTSLEKIAEFSVRSSLRMPGRIPERIHLDIYDTATTNLGRVVLIIDANPIRVEGSIHFDEDATCDFKEYIEGESRRWRGSADVRRGSVMNLTRFPSAETRLLFPLPFGPNMTAAGR